MVWYRHKKKGEVYMAENGGRYVCVWCVGEGGVRALGHQIRQFFNQPCLLGGSIIREKEEEKRVRQITHSPHEQTVHRAAACVAFIGKRGRHEVRARYGV